MSTEPHSEVVYQTYRDYYYDYGTDDCAYTETEKQRENCSQGCENGCWEGCCDPCPCRHNDEVKAMIDDLEERLKYQEEWATELAIANEEYTKWKGEADKQWKTIKHTWDIWTWDIGDGLSMGAWVGTKEVLKKGGWKLVAETGAAVSTTLAAIAERSTTAIRKSAKGYGILHNLQSAENECDFLKKSIEWNGGRISKIRGDIKESCPCALEKNPLCLSTIIAILANHTEKDTLKYIFERLYGNFSGRREVWGLFKEIQSILYNLSVG